MAGKVEPIPLKRTIRHMSGHQLSQAQANANAKLSGMEQLFYVNQLLTLIENELIDRSNPQLMAALDRLAAAIGGSERRAA